LFVISNGLLFYDVIDLHSAARVLTKALFGIKNDPQNVAGHHLDPQKAHTRVIPRV